MRATTLFILLFLIASVWLGRPEPERAPDAARLTHSAWSAAHPLDTGPIEARLRDVAEANLSSGAAQRVSVWLRDLRGGAEAALRADELYQPASLVKVYVMAAAYLREESQPGFLDTPLHYPPNSGIAWRQRTRPREVLERGVEHPARALVEHMVVESDNETLDILLAELRPLAYTIAHHNGMLPLADGSQRLVTARSFGGLVRALFDGVLLGRASSERALALMARTRYRDGLVAGVPPGITVAHKFGEHGAWLSGDRRVFQLHDCGIVYAPERPYVLCVMTQGDDLDALDGVLRDLSAAAWHAVNGAERGEG